MKIKNIKIGPIVFTILFMMMTFFLKPGPIVRFAHFLFPLNASAAELYIWLDEKGGKHITDRPPEKTAKMIGNVASNPDSPEEINMIPMYGEKPKSSEMLKADQEFIQTAIATAGSRENAAAIAIRKGWEYIEGRAAASAIKRFNQAWLLTPNKGDVYLGFGAAVGLQGKVDESIKFFEKANTLLPNNARLMCDYGYSYIWKGQALSQSPKEADMYYDRAISLFEKASILEPNYERIYSDWSIVLFFKRDYSGAWQKVKQAEGLGGKTIDKKLIDDLSQQMKRPL